MMMLIPVMMIMGMWMMAEVVAVVMICGHDADHDDDNSDDDGDDDDDDDDDEDAPDDD